MSIKTSEEPTEEPQQNELICSANGPYTAICEPDSVTIQLDGSGSEPSDDIPLSYKWTSDCPGATFDDDTLESPALTIDTSVECPTECTVTLTVDDGLLGPMECTSAVSVLGRLQCDAGGTYEEECQGATTVVALDGTASLTVEEGATLTYEWSSDCPGATFDDNTSATPMLTLDSSQGCTTECMATLTVNDGINDAQTCMTDIVVADGTGPVLEGAPEQEELPLDCNAEIPVPPTVTATDVCDGGEAVVDFNEVDEGEDCARTITRTWTATDACQNTSTATQVITFTDDTAPEITLDQDLELSVQCDDELPAAATATVTDNCDEGLQATLEESDDELTCPRTVTRTWTATDACGNTGSVTQTIVVEDTTPPVIELDQELEVSVQCDDELPAPATATVTDNCDEGLEATLEESDDEQTCPRTVTRTWTATDACGNTGSVTQTIVVDDTTPPTIELNGDAEITLECGLDEYVEMGAVVTDNCDDPSDAIVGGDTVDTGTPGTYEVTYDGEDACGNTAQATRTVHVVDTIPPEVTVGDMHLLWPPNHKHTSLDLSDLGITIVDACAGELDLSEVATIVEIYSDEPENAKGNGDGNTTDDIVIGGDTGFELRVERAGGGNGRVYGITFEVSDPSGNTAEATAYVGVPHDQGGDPPVDDGPDAGYTVSSDD